MVHKALKGRNIQPYFFRCDAKGRGCALESLLLASPTHPWPPLNPGLCPGLGCYAPSGLKNSFNKKVLNLEHSYSLTFTLVFSPNGGRVFIAVLGKAGIVERCWYYKNGIKARPANGSGAERGAGMPERHCLSHAVGGASCAAWQLRPRGTHRVGLFSLDFLWFFLVSRQERT